MEKYRPYLFWLERTGIPSSTYVSDARGLARAYSTQQFSRVFPAYGLAT